MAAKPLAVLEDLVFVIMPAKIDNNSKEKKKKKKSKDGEDNQSSEENENEESEEEAEFSTDYGTLTNSSFVVYYKVLLAQLSNLFHNHVRIHVDTDNTEEVQPHLMRIDKCVTLFQAIIQMTKLKGMLKQILAITLKNGKTFIENFLKCMPFLAKTFSDQTNLVHAILKNLQVATRIMQVWYKHFQPV